MAEQGSERRLAARRLRQAGAGRKEERRGGDLVLVEMSRFQLPVGRRRLAVEGQREVVGGPDLTKGRRGPPLAVDGQIPAVHALGLQEVPDELAVAVVAYARDDRRLDAEAGQAGCHVAGEPADVPRVVTHLPERRPQLVGVQVDPDPAEDCCFDQRSQPSTRVRLRSSAARTTGMSATVTVPRYFSIPPR